MAVWRIRLEDPDSDEFRQVSVEAESEDEARAIVVGIEAKHVAYRADAETQAEIVDAAGAGVESFDAALALSKDEQRAIPTLRGRERARLNSHRQTRPYAIKRVEGPADEGGDG